MSLNRYATKPNKYRNVPTMVDDIRFASKREARRYAELKMLERNGDIANLVMQPRYPLVVQGKLVCTYVGDFQYDEVKSGRRVTEDAKGVKTGEFIIKAKMFHALYGREVTLV